MTSLQDINKKLLIFINNNSIEHKYLQKNIQDLQKLVFDNITKKIISEGNIPLELLLHNSSINNEKLNLLISDNVKDFLEYKITEKYEIIQKKNEISIDTKIENYFTNTNIQDKILSDTNNIILDEKINKFLKESIEQQNLLHKEVIDKIENNITVTQLSHEDNLNRKLQILHSKINKPITDIKEDFKNLVSKHNDTNDNIINVRNDTHKNFTKIEQTFSRMQAESDRKIINLQKIIETYRSSFNDKITTVEKNKDLILNKGIENNQIDTINNNIYELKNELNNKIDNIKKEFQEINLASHKNNNEVSTISSLNINTLKEELLTQISEKLILLTDNFDTIIEEKINKKTENKMNTSNQMIITNANTTYLQEEQAIELFNNKNKILSNEILQNVEYIVNTKFVELNKHVREYMNNHSLEVERKNRSFCAKIEVFIENQIKTALATVK